MAKLLDALQGKNRGRPPIWLMRQAGRYLPQYRKIKEGRSLLEMFHHPETIVETTLLPVELLHVDAAILFSDILTVLDGLSFRYTFQEGVGPVILDPPSSLKRIPPDEAYSHIDRAIRILKQELNVPLLGFAGAPFTVASYIIEAKTSKDLKKTKQWLFQDPRSFQTFIDHLTEATIEYLDVQINAGADALQIFDSWANALGIEEFTQYSLKPMKRIVEHVKKRGIPIILFCRGSCFFAPELASLSPTAISLDWSGDLATMRKKIPKTISIQGNLDPMALYAPIEAIADKVNKLLLSMHNDPSYIFNLGHGLLPDIPVDHVKFLVDYVRSAAFAEA